MKIRQIWDRIIAATSLTTPAAGSHTAEEPRSQGNIWQALALYGGGKWAGGLSSSGRVAEVGHAIARRNARNAMQDSVQARAVVERRADTISDGGLRLELAPIVEMLGITREYATTWARDVEQRFDLWARSKRQHRTEQMNWYQSQRLWSVFSERDNDQFVRLFYEDDRTLQNPLQFDFIDPDMVRGDAYTTTAGFNGVGYDGIERDDRGREKAYKVFVRQKTDTGEEFKEVTLPRVYPGGRIAVLHGFRPEYAGQTRGYSRLAHAVQELENITDFSAATIKKAINQSNIVAFVEPSKNEDATNPLEELLAAAGGGAGPAALLYGTNPQEVAGVDVEPDPAFGPETFYRTPEALLETPGGMVIGNLKKGQTFKGFHNSAPGDSYDKFVDAFFGYLSASMNIPIEVVLMKFGQNYSASRATLLLFWRICMIERDEMASDYLNPVVEMWLSGEIAAGRVAAPGWSDPRMRAAWLNCNWIGSAAPDIDPAKSAKARKENLSMAATNIDREARDFNGTSAADNIAKNNAAYANAKPMPWEPPPPAAPAPAPGKSGKDAKAMMEELQEQIDALWEQIGA